MTSFNRGPVPSGFQERIRSIAQNYKFYLEIGGILVGEFLECGGLVIERELKERFPGRLGRAAPVLNWLITFHVVCLAWIFFRAETFASAWEILGRMVTGWGASPAITPLLLLVIAGSIASQFVPPRWWERVQVSFSRLAPFAQAGTLALGLVLIDALGPEGVAPFIYFQF